MKSELLNMDAIKEKVKAALAMDDALAGMRDQITAELTGAGASIEQVQSALNGVLGGAGLGGATGGAAVGAAPMTQAITVTPQFDVAAVRAAGVTAGVEFAAGMNAPEAANKFSASFMLGMKEFYGRFFASGAASANEYSNGFLQQFRSSVPVEIVLALATLVTPEVLKALAAQGAAEGAL